MAGHTEPHTLYTDGASAVPGDALEPGSVIAGYRIDGVLGRGGMGVVYAATDAELGRRVALKVVPAVGSDARQHQQFLREAMSAATVEHPHILPVYRSGEDGGMLYIAMRLVDGESLQQLVQTTGPLPAHRAARIVAQVGQALDAAHARGLVHRDVKPANILIADPGEDEHAYLADFGIAAASGSSRRWSGTFAYTAPEQLTEGTVDARGDVYALGCVLYFCLTGRPPFDADNEVAAVAARQSQPPSLAGTAPDHIPAELDTVVARALSTDPRERFASAGALGQAALAARFDVAVCSHADDRAVATALCEQLTERGMTTITVDVASPSAALHAAGGCVVVVGRSGLAGWARSAVVAARDLAARDRSYRLVTAIVPGGPSPFDPRLAFLGAYPWADLRDGVDAGTDRVVRALSGHATQRLGEATDLECPYPGLEAFDEEQASDFFGREREIEQVVEQLEASRFIAIVGASGSGKSSLVRAGVVPRLRRDADDRTTVITVVPGASPIAALSAALAATLGLSQADVAAALDDEGGLDRLVGATDPPLRLVVVVDQFEEVFTLCPDPAERERFMSTLAYAATVPDGAVSVIIACRADFVHRLAEHDGLRQLAAAHQLSLGTMSAANLRDAIERPARRMGVDLEPGLTRRILTDLPREAGSLPLLGHLLRELWERRSADTLTLAAYDAAGGVGGALARHADSVMADMTDDQREIARRLLLRLTQPGDGTEDTRRRATKSELLSIGDPETVEPVLARLTAGRLVSTGVDEHGDVTVDVAHEALIRNWPTLRSWIHESRDQLRLHRRLTDASRDWEAAQRDDGMLFRGASLAAWRDRDQSELNATEAAFLDASLRAGEREHDARVRRLRMAIGGLSAAVVAVGAVATMAAMSRNTASEQRDLARSREVAANAREQLALNPEVATLAAREAYAIAPTAEAESTLREALAAMRVRGGVKLHDGAVAGFDIATSGDVAVSAGMTDGLVAVFDPGSAADPAPRTLGHDLGPLVDVDINDAGSQVTALTQAGTLLYWSKLSGEPVKVPVRRGTVTALAVTADGDTAFVGDDTGSVHVIDLTTRRAAVVKQISPDAIASLAVTRDAATVYAGTRLGDTAQTFAWQRRSDVIRAVGKPHIQGIAALTLDRDASTLASANEDNTLTVATVGTDPSVLDRTVGSASQSAVAITPDGSAIAVGGTDGVVSIWSPTGDQAEVRLPGNDGAVTDVDFLPGTDLVLSVDESGWARWNTWRTADAQAIQPNSIVIGAEMLRDTPAVAVIDLDGAISTLPLTGSTSTHVVRPAGGTYYGSLVSDETWAIVTADQRTVEFSVDGKRGTLPVEAGSSYLKLSANGRWLAVGDFEGHITLFDLTATSKAPVVSASDIELGSPFIAVSPAGVLAVPIIGGTIALWTPGASKPTSVDVGRSEVRSLAFSPDGTHLAYGTKDGGLRVLTPDGVPAGRLLHHSGSAESVKFTADGSLLVSAGDEVRVTNWRTGGLVAQWPGSELVDATYDPRTHVAIAGGMHGITRLTCETCGSPNELLTLAEERVTRQLTADEYTALVGSDS